MITQSEIEATYNDVVDNKIQNALEKIKQDNENMWLNAVEMTQKMNDPGEIRKIIKEVPPVVTPSVESKRRLMDVDYYENQSPKPRVPELEQQLKQIAENPPVLKKETLTKDPGPDTSKPNNEPSKFNQSQKPSAKVNEEVFEDKEEEENDAKEEAKKEDKKSSNKPDSKVEDKKEASENDEEEEEEEEDEEENVEESKAKENKDNKVKEEKKEENNKKEQSEDEEVVMDDEDQESNLKEEGNANKNDDENEEVEEEEEPSKDAETGKMKRFTEDSGKNTTNLKG